MLNTTKFSILAIPFPPNRTTRAPFGADFHRSDPPREKNGSRFLLVIMFDQPIDPWNSDACATRSGELASI